MGYDLIILTVRYFLISAYFMIFMVNIIFAFFLDRYQRMNEILQTEIFSFGVVTQLELSNINIDEWLFTHHKSVGLLLSFLSLFNAFMLNRLFLRL
ncbi:hypothetical protein ACFL1D_04875 [Candidatus Omnitrophota bacterium]